MIRFKPTKVERMLSLYSRLINNEQIDKKKETEEWEISDKSFERDKEEMNLFLARQGSRRKIKTMTIFLNTCRKSKIYWVHNLFTYFHIFVIPIKHKVCHSEGI